MSDSETLLLPHCPNTSISKPHPRRYCYTARPQHLYTQPQPKRHCLTTPPNTWTPSHIQDVTALVAKPVHPATFQDVTATPLVPTPINPATSKTLLPSSQHLYTQPHPRRHCHTARPNTFTHSHIQDVTATLLVQTPVHRATSKTLLPLVQHLYTQPHPMSTPPVSAMSCL